MILLKPQADFPLLNEYKQHFEITKRTIFAYDDSIYCDYTLPDDLLIHEITHIEQQKRDGLDFWVYNYLNNIKYRLEQEVEAYRKQIKSIKDRNFKAKIRVESAQQLSSSLYGNIVDFQEAMKLLKC